jgi:hypothetical protein
LNQGEVVDERHDDVHHPQDSQPPNPCAGERLELTATNRPEMLDATALEPPQLFEWALNSTLHYSPIDLRIIIPTSQPARDTIDLLLP